MNRALRLIVRLAMLSLATLNAAFAESASIVSIPTPRGVQQSFILIKPDHAIAAVVLFAGGNGVLQLNRVPPPAVGAYAFVAGKYLKGQAEVPVWLIGTSAGSWSAARGAIGAQRDEIATGSIDGLVLTSTVTRIAQGSGFARAFPQLAREYPQGVASMPLSEIRVPTLIMSHSDDACEYTPALDAPVLAKRLTQAIKVEITLLNGGDPARSAPCEAYAAHGYYGVETEAVGRIAGFIIATSKREP